MAYCTLADLKKVLPEQRLRELTDDGSLGSVGQGSIDEAIALADGEIDTYLGGRYAVPLSDPAPDVIRRCSCDIAVYHLYARKGETIPETRELRYRDAVRILTRISDGKMSLPVSEEPDSGFASGVLVTSHFEEDEESA